MALPQLQPLLKTVAMGRSRFLYGLDRTPDERLDWRPGPDALTPLELAGKCARFLLAGAHRIQHRTMPERPASPPPAPPTRAEAKATLEAAFVRLESALQALTQADLDQPVPTPWGQPITVAEVLWSVPAVIGYHQGQLNYTQRIYGDTDANIPPNWGQEKV